MLAVVHSGNKVQQTSGFSPVTHFAANVATTLMAYRGLEVGL
jgi:hypothetical protein